MKKFLAHALALVMALSIAGCGSKDSSTGGQTDTPSNTDSNTTGGDAAQADGVGRYTYTAVSSDPNTWSPTDWQNDDELTYWTWCITSLWEYMINDTSVIFITHDLGVVANMADKVAVMYAGKIVEYGTAEDVFYSPAHPYTWALLSSMPDLDTKEKLEAIPGTPPNMIHPPEGDAFAERNHCAMQIDFERQPPPFKISDTHWAATWLLHPDAPKAVTDRIKRMRELEAASDGN